MDQEDRQTKDRRRFLKRLAIGAGLAAPVLVTLADRKVVAQTGPGPTPTGTPVGIPD